MKIIHMPKMRALYSILNIGIKSRGVKWISALLSCLLLAGLLTACDNKDVEAADTILHYSIPFAEQSNHWNTVTLLEEDDYGRKLFLSESVDDHYNAFSDFSGENIYSYIIVQQETKDYVFCYADSCYVYVQTSSSDSEIPQLKEANDWNEPLEPKKMTALQKGISGLWHIDSYGRNTIRNALKEKVDFSDAYVDVVYSSQKAPYFILREVERQETPPHKFGRAWIVSVDESYCLKTYRELEKHPRDWISDINEFINANPGTPLIE